MMNVWVDQRKERACYTLESTPIGVSSQEAQGAHMRAPRPRRGAGSPEHESRCIRPALHPAHRRCFSVAYCLYASSARLGGPAHHRSRCDAGLVLRTAGPPQAAAWGSGRSPSEKAGQPTGEGRPGARQCAPRGRGVGRWGPASGRVGFGAKPRLSTDDELDTGRGDRWRPRGVRGSVSVSGSGDGCHVDRRGGQPWRCVSVSRMHAIEGTAARGEGAARGARRGGLGCRFW